MSLDQFIALRAVAKHHSITRAAEELHLTQPALSKQLRLLQDEYQLKLYYKSDGRGIELTEEGRLFLAYVNNIISGVDELKARFKNVAARTLTKPLVVGGTYALGSELLPRLVSEFKELHPMIDVRLRTTCSFGIHKEILSGDVEVGLVAKTPESERLRVEPYGRHPLVAFVHADHSYGRKDGLSPAELASSPLVLRGAHQLRSTAEIALTERGYQPNVVLRCDSPESVRIAVKNKLGVGVLFHDAVRHAIERGEFKLLRTPGLVMEAKSFIIYHNERRSRRLQWISLRC